MSKDTSKNNANNNARLINLYRHCTLGLKLNESLQDLKEQDKISEDVIERVMKVYDKCVCNALSNKLSNKVSFKAGCTTFNFNNNVYVWMLNDVNLKMGNTKLDTLDFVKVVACEGTTTTTKKTKKRKSQD
ncbi:predicted protein [Naegleria gruberi]|uniref:Predicted protein n=1 Tax=Naegleria gruberi TaxID=5762 RepID=D2V4V4_NAEGR|nr:uncharacterized protein NAEGRDRAFT_63919 [Naegleria gruberi]EFC47997.1 predicted protein [Naegleria gruberi]|eukprot:XP_002680741.1 predicted protein [Naegleria gruberi strain NEG-M]